MLLTTRRRTDPVKAANARKREAAKEADAKVKELEAKAKELRSDLDDYEKEVQRAAAECKERSSTGHTVQLGTYPSVAQAKARALRGEKIKSELGATERLLRLARQRATEAEKRAEPLSPRALARLEELVGAIEADAELKRAGINIPELMASPSGPTRLLELAEEYGIGGGS